MLFYLVALVIVSLVAFHRKKQAEEEGGSATMAQYGGQFSLGVLMLTTFSSTFSGYTVSGVPANAATGGYISIRWIVAIVAIALGMLAYYPRLRRLSQVRGYTSPGDFIGDRYGSQALQLCCSICACIPQFFYLTVQLVSFAVTVEGLTLGAIPKIWGLVIFAVIVLAMEMLGGMNSVVLSDALQAGLMITGFLCMLVVLILQYGWLSSFTPANCASLGFVNMTSRALLTELGDVGETPETCMVQEADCKAYGCLEDVKPDWFKPPGLKAQCGFFFFVLNMFAFPLNPHMVQRAYIAKSDQALRVVVGVMFVAGFLCMPPGIMAGLVVATFGKSWSIEPSSPFAAVTSQLMQMGVLQYALAVVLTCSSLAAIMSTADSVMLGVSNTLSLDLFKGWIAPDASERATVHFGTGISALMVTVGIAFGYWITDAHFGNLLLLQNGILLQIVPAYVFGLYLDPSPSAVGWGLGVGLAAFFAGFALSNLGMNPLKGYVPDSNIGFFVNVAVLLLVNLAPRSEDNNATNGVSVLKFLHGKPVTRLSSQEINDCMVGTSEPPRCLLLIVSGLVLCSTPFWAEDDYTIRLGMPDWALMVVLLTIVAAVLGITGALLWRPVCEATNAIGSDSDDDSEEE